MFVEDSVKSRVSKNVDSNYSVLFIGGGRIQSKKPEGEEILREEVGEGIVPQEGKEKNSSGFSEWRDR